MVDMDRWTDAQWNNDNHNIHNNTYVNNDNNTNTRQLNYDTNMIGSPGSMDECTM